MMKIVFTDGEKNKAIRGEIEASEDPYFVTVRLQDDKTITINRKNVVFIKEL